MIRITKNIDVTMMLVGNTFRIEMRELESGDYTWDECDMHKPYEMLNNLRDELIGWMGLMADERDELAAEAGEDAEN